MAGKNQIVINGNLDVVRVHVWCASEDGPIILIYSGLKEDLIATGSFSEGMFQKKQKKHLPRLDDRGDRYRVESYWCTRADQPIRRFRVWRYKSKSQAAELPGAMRALALYRKERRESNERYERLQEERNRCEAEQLQEYNRKVRAALPSNPADWKEEELDSMRSFIRILTDTEIRQRISDKQFADDRGGWFRLYKDDADDLQALGVQFIAKYERILRGARVDDLRQKTSGEARSLLQLVVNNS
ncbi:MAG: hypothetical protein QM808_16220 [Steroidobacteraceae bacterium]